MFPKIGNYAFRIDPDGRGIQFSDEISYIFYSAEGPIDAALTYEGKTFLFKVGQVSLLRPKVKMRRLCVINLQGDKYWRYVNRKVDGSFPRRISEDFPGIPDNLDAGK